MTQLPSHQPTDPMTQLPSHQPTNPMTQMPSHQPTNPMTQMPSHQPTNPMTQMPSHQPTNPMTQMPADLSPGHLDRDREVTPTKLLVIGAGPYGLAAAAAAKAIDIEPLVVGDPMGFWRHNMPAGMLLRSSVDWHLDPLGQHTLSAYLQEAGVAASDVDPIPLELFIDYAEWFRTAKHISVHQARVHDLHRADGKLEATLTGGHRVRADTVVAAPGVEPFTRLPSWVQRALPTERYSHTAHLGKLERFSGARVLIVGGRQSAFETAALLAELGAERVDIVHRHAPPRFTPADWRFVEPLMEATQRWPGWFRRLTTADRQAIERRFWAEGRLKLEPWLTPRLARAQIQRWPEEIVTGATEDAGDGISATLSNGQRLNADHIIFATGYQADIARVPYLAGVLDHIQVADGYPVLDEHFQTSIPGLFITGFAATRDFGPFFGFVRGSTAAATIIAREPIVAAAGVGGDSSLPQPPRHRIGTARRDRRRAAA
jgi:FAD-dependent urate hydroxylase